MAAEHCVVFVPAPGVVVVSQREMRTRVRLPPVHQQQEILALHRRRGAHTEEAKYGGRHVGGGGGVVAGLSRSLAFGMAHQKDNIRKLRIQGARDLAREAVLAVGDTVVGEEYEEGVIEEAQFLQLV